MDPVSLIIKALTDVLTAAAKDIASDEIKTGYKKLKEMVLRKFGGEGNVSDALENVEKKPASPDCQKTLSKELTKSGAAEDTELLEQARILLALLEMAARSWETGYLHTLIAQCDLLDLSPIDETRSQSADTAEAIKISDVFTTLYLAGVTRYPSQSVTEALVPQKDSELPRAKERDEEPLPIQALEAVAALPKLVILGKPGGGKTTLVNHLATQLAYRHLKNKERTKELPGWTDEAPTLPVRIILRRFAAWLPADAHQGDCGHVWNYLEHRFDEWGRKNAFIPLQQKLDKEGGVIIFDGLDEVRQTDVEPKRTIIKEAIAQFSKSLPNCKIIVTCREYAYQKGDAWRLPEADFPEAQLALFAPEQIEAFTRTWYRTVGPMKGWGADKCQIEAEHLNAAIEMLPHLRELAPYPLLLTLMAQVHGRDGNLPEDRADLYEKATNLLLSHWENRIVRDIKGNRKIEPGLVMQLGVRAETLRAALERAAFEAHERQEKESSRGEQCADIPKEGLRDLLKIELGSWDKAETVIDYIQTRAGLLQAEDHRIYRFPHRTFQEYLAATHILKQGEFDTLLKDRICRDLNWWREVFLLAAGASRLTPRNISDMVDSLLPEKPQGKIVTPAQAAQAQLAAQALHETDFAEHVRKQGPGRYARVFECVQSWLVAAMVADESLSTKERAAAGRALAKLGDPRFREDAWFLPDDPLLGFVKIPAGLFLMGDDNMRVTLPTFYISRYPVTVAQFQAFVEAKGYAETRYWPEAQAAGIWHEGKVKGLLDDKVRNCPARFGEPFDFANHPVVGITWYEALAYCRWLTERLQQGKNSPEPLASLLRENGWRVNLPSEAQWEKASRGCDGPIYPWGERFDAERVNCKKNGIGTTCAVGSFPKGLSPFEIEDMSGNVWEWCATKWRENYEQGQEDNDPDSNENRVLRGGSFDRNEERVRCAFRGLGHPASVDNDIGFRVALSSAGPNRYN